MNFFNGQIEANSKPKKGMRWSPSQKRFAASLYMKSPAAYRLLAKKWRLPCKNTLINPARQIFKDVSILL